MTTFDAVDKWIDGAMGKYNSEKWKEVLAEDLKPGILFKMSYEPDATIFEYNGITNDSKFIMTNTYTTKPVENIGYRPNKIVLVKV
jgi:hypothetical protein